MSPSTNSIRARDVIVLGLMGLLLFTWVFPISALASLLSYKEIKKVMPWLGRWIDSNEQIRAIVQNSLPSVAMITLNALLPFMLEGVWPAFTMGYWMLMCAVSVDVFAGLQSEELGRVFVAQKVSACCPHKCSSGLTNVIRCFDHIQVLPIPPYQRRLYLPFGIYVLATRA